MQSSNEDEPNNSKKKERIVRRCEEIGGNFFEADNFTYSPNDVVPKTTDDLMIYLPDDNAPVSVIEFIKGDVCINGKTISTDIHWTVSYPFYDMLIFAEDIIAGHDQVVFSIDPEGPEVYFLATKAPSPENIKLVVYWNSIGSGMEKYVEKILSAIISRRQLAECFIHEAECFIQESEIAIDVMQPYINELKQMIRKLTNSN